jgi:hypothetical protein
VNWLFMKIAPKLVKLSGIFWLLDGRDNHQRLTGVSATGDVQSRKRGCERLEREQGVSVVRRKSDQRGLLLTYSRPLCDGMAPQRIRQNTLA